MDDLVKTQSGPADEEIADTKCQPSSDAQSVLSMQRLAILYDHLPGSILANLASLCLILVILWPTTPHFLLTGWASIVTLIMVARGTSWYFWRQQLKRVAAISSLWLILFSVGTLATAIAWGTAGLILVPDGSILHLCIIALWVCGLSAGAANSLAISMRLFLSFSIPAIFPLAIFLFSSAGQTEFFLASAMLLFFALMTFTALQTRKVLLNNLSLQSDNTRLIRELAGDKDRIEQDNWHIEQELVRNQALFRQAEKLGKLGHWAWDNIEKRLIACSNEYASIYDMSMEEVMTEAGTLKEDLNFIHPEDRQRYADADGAWDKYEVFDIEYRMVARNGRVVHVHEIGEPVFDESGKPVKTFGTLQDITERKLAEEELHKSHELQSQAEQLGKLGYWEWDEIEHRMIACSEQYARIYDMTVEEIMTEAGTLEDDLRFFHPDDRQRYRETTAACQRDATVIDIEFRIITSKGKVVHVHEMGEPVCDEQGTLIRTFGTLQDISERKQADEELFKRQVFSIQAEQLGRLGHWEWDYLSDRMTTCSEVYAQIHEMSVDEAIAFFSNATSELDIIHPDDRERYHHHLDETEEKRQGTDIEYRVITQSGNVLHVHQRSELNLDNKGEIISAFGTVQDITERKLAEQELYKNQIFSRQAEQLGKLGNWEWDYVNERMINCSEVFAQIYEMSVDETIAAFSTQGSEFDIVHPDDLERYKQHILETDEKRQGTDIEYRMITRSGNVRNIHQRSELKLDEQGEIISAFGTAQDITERKLAEEELHKSQALFNRAEKIGGLGHWEWDEREGRLIYCSEQYAAICGLTVEEMMATCQSEEEDFSDIHPDDLERVCEAEKIFQNNSGRLDIEYRIFDVNGEVRHVHQLGEVEADDAGKVIRSFGTLQDITDRKQADMALRFNQFTVEQNTDEVYWISEDGTISYANKGASKKLGYSNEELLNMRVADFDPDYPMEVWADHWQKLKQIKHSLFETRHQTKAGHIFPVEVHVDFFEYEGEEFICSSVRDISARKSAEQALEKSHALFQQAEEISQIGHWEWDEVNDCMFSCSEQLAAIYEMTVEEALAASTTLMNDYRTIHPDDLERYKQANELAMGQTEVNMEYRIITKTGKVRHVHEIGEACMDEHGKMRKRTFGILRDITEQKLAEDELYKSHSLFKQAEHLGKLGFWEWDEIEQRLIACSDEYARIYDMSVEEVLADAGTLDNYIQFIHPNDQHRYRKAEISSRNNATTFDIEYRIITRSGAERYVHELGEDVLDENGELIRTFGILQDITVRKLTEEKLQKNYALYKQTEKLGKVGHWEWDYIANRLSSCSEQYADIFEMAIDEVLETLASDDEDLEVVHEDDRAQYTQATQLAYERKEGWDLEYRIITRTGKVVYVHEISELVLDEHGTPVRAFGTLQDVSEIKLAERTLLEANTRYMQAEELGQLGHWEWDDLKRQLLNCSAEYARIFDMTPEEAISTFSDGETAYHFIHPEDKDRYASHLNTYDTRHRDIDLEYRIITRDEETRHVHERGVFITDDEGKRISSHGTLQDITERKLTEEELRKSHALFGQAEQLGKLGHWEWNEIEQRMLACSEEYARIYDMSVEEVMRDAGTFEDDVQFIHPDDRQRYRDTELACRCNTRNLDIEYRIITRAGRTVHVHELGESVFDEHGVLLRTYGTLQDITERKLVEEALTQSHALFKQAEQIGKLGYWEWDEIEQRLITCSEQYAQIYDMSVEEVLRDAGTLEADLKFIHPDDRQRYRDMDEASRLNATKYDMEYRLITRTGRLVYVRELSELVLDEHGSLVRTFGTLQDITEQKLVEEALQKSHALYSQAEQMGKMGYWEWDILANRLIACSSEYASIYDMSVEEVLADAGTLEDDIQFIHPDDQNRYREAELASRINETPFNIEYRIITRSGDERYVHELGEEVLDEKGKLIRTFGILQDITEQKLAQTALEESEERHRLLLETMNHGMGAINLDGKFTYVNDRNCEIFGYSHDELIGKPIIELLDEENKKILLDQVEKRKRGEYEPYEITWIRKNGERVETIAAPAPLYDKQGNYEGSFATITNITERKHAERALKKSERQLLGAQRMAHVGNWYNDYSTNQINMSDEMYRIFGLSKEKEPVLTFERILEIIHPEDRERIANNFEIMIATGNSGNADYRVIRPDGSERYVSSRREILCDENGNDIGMSGTVQDITERKQGEDALKSSEELLRYFFDAKIVGMMIVGTDMQWIQVNDEFCRIVGYTREEVMECTWQDITLPEDIDKDLQLHEEILSGERDGYSMEKRYIHKDGHIVPITLYVECVRHEDGSPNFYIVFNQDESERKRIEKEVEDTELRYKRLVDVMQEGLNVVDEDFRISFFNQRLCDMLGYTLDEVIGKPALDFYDGEDLEIIQEQIEIRKQGKHEPYEVAWICKDGSKLLTLLSPNPIYNSAGEFTGSMAVVSDITERKQAEEALRKSEQLLRYFFDTKVIGMMLVGTDMNWLQVNDEFCRMLGYTQDEMKDLTWPDLAHPDDLDDNQQLYEETMEGSRDGYTMQKRYVHKDGESVYVNLSVECVHDNDGNPNFFIAFVENITKRTQFEKESRESEARYKRLVDTMQEGLNVVDTEFNIAFSNQRLCDMLGYTLDELVGKPAIDFFDGEDMEITKQQIELRKQGKFNTYEVAWIRMDGSKISTIVSPRPIYNNEGVFTGSIGVVTDITERKKIEKDLIESEGRFHGAFDNTVIAMSINKLDGPYMVVNPAMCEFSGYTEAELLTKTNLDITHPDDWDETNKNFQRLLDGKADHFLMEKRYINKAGDVRWGQLSVAIVRNTKGEGLYFVPQIQDITERKNLEAEIKEHQLHLETEVARRTAELASANKELQAFAHSVSHDLKAPLRSIEGFAEILQEDYGEVLEENALDYLSEIGAGAVRMGEMVDDLLAHATLGKGFANVTEVDLDRILKKVKQDLSSDIKEKKAKISIKGKLGSLSGHQATLEALLQNILSNAIKYVDKESPPEVLISRSETDKEYVIAVKDNGIGIEKEHQDRIFGIFERLHTREEYPGTGIGLAIAEKAVQLHRGRLWLESEPGVGTTFYFSVDKNLKKQVSDNA